LQHIKSILGRAARLSFFCKLLIAKNINEQNKSLQNLIVYIRKRCYHKSSVVYTAVIAVQTRSDYGITIAQEMIK